MGLSDTDAMATGFWDACATIPFAYVCQLIESVLRWFENKTNSFGHEECAFPPRQSKVAHERSRCGEIYWIGLRTAHVSAMFFGLSIPWLFSVSKFKEMVERELIWLLDKIVAHTNVNFQDLNKSNLILKGSIIGSLRRTCWEMKHVFVNKLVFHSKAHGFINRASYFIDFEQQRVRKIRDFYVTRRTYSFINIILLRQIFCSPLRKWYVTISSNMNVGFRYKLLKC